MKKGESSVKKVTFGKSIAKQINYPFYTSLLTP